MILSEIVGRELFSFLFLRISPDLSSGFTRVSAVASADLGVSEKWWMVNGGDGARNMREGNKEAKRGTKFETGSSAVRV